MAVLNILEIDNGLMEAAAIRAAEITSNFSHTRPNGERFKTAVEEAGFTADYVGENIAAGMIKPESVMGLWMDSKGHKENILNPNYKYIGVGYSVDDESEYYWVQIFGK